MKKQIRNNTKVKIKLYDVKGKKKFTPLTFELKTRRNPRTKRMTYFAVANAPSGIKSWRIVSKDFYQKNK